MTQEEKWLVLKDLCARLPYGVKVFHGASSNNGIDSIGGYYTYTGNQFYLNESEYWAEVDELKPYLRSLSNMTKEEIPYYQAFFNYDGIEFPEDYIDWLNEHHFDYHGLIAIGLAIEAPENMYLND